MHRSSRRSFLKTSGLAAGALTVGFAGSASALDMSRTSRTAATVAQGLKLARVWATGADADIIAGFDDTHRVFDDGSFEVLLWPGDLGKLAQTGLRFQITVDDLVARDRARAENDGGRQASLALQPGETEGEYRTLEQYNADMDFLAETYSDICVKIELPYKSFEGRTVYGLIISSTKDAADGKPVFYNDGIHHAREWPAAEVPIMWAYDLCEGWENGDARITNIVEKTRNIIVPVVNVDGFVYSRAFPVQTGTDQVGVSEPSGVLGGNGAEAAIGGGQYWRKTRRALIDHETGVALLGGVGSDPNGLTAYGVDPNRNYSYHWGGDGSDTHMTGQTYRGETPFSEPETRNVQWVHRNWHCVAGITHHTSGDLILWAWGDTGSDAPDDALLARLGFAQGVLNGYRPTKSIDLYVTTGVCSDYTYGTWGSISYTFEHAGDSFHPPYASTVPAMYAKNREALMMQAELICMEPEDRGFLKAQVAENADLQNRLFGAFSISPDGVNRTYEYEESSALDLDARYNCQISGRFVDSAGNGVKGSVRINKDFENFLWFFGDGDNPIEQSQWPEATEDGLEIETDDDGNFSWTINPSSRPAYEEDSFTSNDQRPEAWTVSFLVPNPDRNSTGQRLVSADELVIFRGETKDYGTIVVD